jgi:hypothetical protein
MDPKGGCSKYPRFCGKKRTKRRVNRTERCRDKDEEEQVLPTFSKFEIGFETKFSSVFVFRVLLKRKDTRVGFNRTIQERK